MHVHFLEWWRVNQSPLCFPSIHMLVIFLPWYMLSVHQRKDDDEYFMHFKLLNLTRFAFASNAKLICQQSLPHRRRATHDGRTVIIENDKLKNWNLQSTYYEVSRCFNDCNKPVVSLNRARISRTWSFISRDGFSIHYSNKAFDWFIYSNKMFPLLMYRNNNVDKLSAGCAVK